jgi:hypothetical protein
MSTIRGGDHFLTAADDNETDTISFTMACLITGTEQYSTKLK